MERARIVIVNHNDGEFIGTAIESALAQSVHCQIVVVDNGSADGSVDAIETRYPSVRIVKTNANLGFAAATTIGAFAPPPDYQYVAFLNPDASAQPHWIERMCAWMEDEGIGIASSVVSGGDRPFFAGGTWRPFLGSAIKRFAYVGEGTQWVSGCAMIVLRETFEMLNGFDRSYFLYYEDVDLSLRATARGVRIAVYPDALVDHPQEGRTTGRVGLLQKRCNGLRSKGKLVRRFVPLVAMPSALFFQCIVSPAINGAPLREYPALVRAFIEGFQEGSADIA